MTALYTEAEIVEAVADLTRDQLIRYVHLRIVTPVQTAAGPRFAEIDLRRTSLLCELEADMELSEDAIVIVMSLLDQLHGTRARLGALMDVLAAEEAEVRERIARRLGG